MLTIFGKRWIYIKNGIKFAEIFFLVFIDCLAILQVVAKHLYFTDLAFLDTSFYVVHCRSSTLSCHFPSKSQNIVPPTLFTWHSSNSPSSGWIWKVSEGLQHQVKPPVFVLFKTHEMTMKLGNLCGQGNRHDGILQGAMLNPARACDERWTCHSSPRSCIWHEKKLPAPSNPPVPDPWPIWIAAFRSTTMPEHACHNENSSPSHSKGWSSGFYRAYNRCPAPSLRSGLQTHVKAERVVQQHSFDDSWCLISGTAISLFCMACLQTVLHLGNAGKEKLTEHMSCRLQGRNGGQEVQDTTTWTFSKISWPKVQRSRG